MSVLIAYVSVIFEEKCIAFLKLDKRASVIFRDFSP